jgi:D-aspartate ligase
LPLINDSFARTQAVAIFDCEHPHVLNSLSQLGKRGVRLDLYSHRRLPAGFFSHRAARRARCPDPSSFDEFSHWFRERLVSGEIQRVLPSSDLVVFHCAELRDFFAPEVRSVIPTAQEIERAVFKPRFYEACIEAGIGVPVTMLPRSKVEALAMAKQIGYPILIKPKTHIGIGLDYRGAIVRSEEELSAAMRPLPVAGFWSKRLEHWTDLQWPMLQQYLPEARQRVYNVSGYVDETRGVVAMAGACKTSHFPPGVGIGASCDSSESPALLDAARRIATRVLANGLFDVEFIEHDGVMLAIDFNPRLGALASFDIARGNDLPWLWYQATLGQRPVVQPPPKNGLTWRHEVPFHLRRLIQLLRGPRRAQRFDEYRQCLRQPSISVVEQADFLPRWIHRLGMFRHPRYLWRVFWADRPEIISDQDRRRDSR